MAGVPVSQLPVANPASPVSVVGTQNGATVQQEVPPAAHYPEATPTQAREGVSDTTLLTPRTASTINETLNAQLASLWDPWVYTTVTTTTKVALTDLPLATDLTTLSLGTGNIAVFYDTATGAPSIPGDTLRFGLAFNTTYTTVVAGARSTVSAVYLLAEFNTAGSTLWSVGTGGTLTRLVIDANSDLYLGDARGTRPDDQWRILADNANNAPAVVSVDGFWIVDRVTAGLTAYALAYSGGTYTVHKATARFGGPAASATQIRDQLETLTGGDRLAVSAIDYDPRWRVIAPSVTVAGGATATINLSSGYVLSSLSMLAYQSVTSDGGSGTETFAPPLVLMSSSAARLGALDDATEGLQFWRASDTTLMVANKGSTTLTITLSGRSAGVYEPVVGALAADSTRDGDTPITLTLLSGRSLADYDGFVVGIPDYTALSTPVSVSVVGPLNFRASGSNDPATLYTYGASRGQLAHRYWHAGRTYFHHWTGALTPEFSGGLFYSRSGQSGYISVSVSISGGNPVLSFSPSSRKRVGTALTDSEVSTLFQGFTLTGIWGYTADVPTPEALVVRDSTYSVIFP